MPVRILQRLRHWSENSREMSYLQAIARPSPKNEGVPEGAKKCLGLSGAWPEGESARPIGPGDLPNRGPRGKKCGAFSIDLRWCGRWRRPWELYDRLANQAGSRSRSRSVVVGLVLRERRSFASATNKSHGSMPGRHVYTCIYLVTYLSLTQAATAAADFAPSQARIKNSFSFPVFVPAGANLQTRGKVYELVTDPRAL